jgi:TonB family protein
MIRTTGVLVATLGIAAGVGCASRPAPSSAPAAPPRAAVAPGPQLVGLVLDPRGADFTDWIDDFKRKVHHNWVPPTYFGYGGEAEFSFTVERNGSLSALQMLKSAGTEPLDRAAHDALTRSRLEPLPADFEPPRVTMRVTFVYGPPPGE